ncbi:hypothetical protein LCGC14_2767600, partial [marine sediment metagenome]
NLRVAAPILVGAVTLIVGVFAACGGSESAAGSGAESGGVSTETPAALLAEGDDASGISVSGRGVAVAAPDIASLSLGVSTIRDSARQARDDAASLVTELIASLKDNGIAEEDYHTSRFSIDPEIDYRPNGEQIIRGYRVTSILAVKVRDLDRVGEVIDDAVDAVGDPIRVQGITFSIEEIGALQSEARAQAMADARAKAEELAELAGVDLGKPIAISESSGGGPPVFFQGFAAAEADISTPISPGQLEITVAVQVTYAIS